MLKIIPLLARCLLSFIFLISGIKDLSDFSALTSSLNEKGIAIPAFFATGGLIFLLAGSFSIILGYKSKVGALLLLIFLVPSTLIFHWNLEDHAQVIQLLKNLGLAGGLLFLIAYGPGNWSFDAGKK